MIRSNELNKNYYSVDSAAATKHVEKEIYMCVATWKRPTFIILVFEIQASFRIFGKNYFLSLVWQEIEWINIWYSEYSNDPSER